MSCEVLNEPERKFVVPTARLAWFVSSMLHISVSRVDYLQRRRQHEVWGHVSLLLKNGGACSPPCREVAVAESTTSFTDIGQRLAYCLRHTSRGFSIDNYPDPLWDFKWENTLFGLGSRHLHFSVVFLPVKNCLRSLH